MLSDHPSSGGRLYSVVVCRLPITQGDGLSKQAATRRDELAGRQFFAKPIIGYGFCHQVRGFVINRREAVEKAHKPRQILCSGLSGRSLKTDHWAAKQRYRYLTTG